MCNCLLPVEYVKNDIVSLLFCKSLSLAAPVYYSCCSLLLTVCCLICADIKSLFLSLLSLLQLGGSVVCTDRCLEIADENTYVIYYELYMLLGNVVLRLVYPPIPICSKCHHKFLPKSHFLQWPVPDRQHCSCTSLHTTILELLRKLTFGGEYIYYI